MSTVHSYVLKLAMHYNDTADAMATAKILVWLTAFWLYQHVFIIQIAHNALAPTVHEYKQLRSCICIFDDCLQLRVSTVTSVFWKELIKRSSGLFAPAIVLSTMLQISGIFFSLLLADRTDEGTPSCNRTSVKHYVLFPPQVWTRLNCSLSLCGKHSYQNMQHIRKD